MRSHTTVVAVALLTAGIFAASASAQNVPSPDQIIKSLTPPGHLALHGAFACSQRLATPARQQANRSRPGRRRPSVSTCSSRPGQQN